MSSSLKSTLAVALSLLQAGPALAADANGKIPYFRFNSCPEGTVCAAPPGASKGAQDSGVAAGGVDPQPPPASQPAAALSVEGTFLSDGESGTPVSGRYVGKGGKGPYVMSLSGAPSGFALTSLDDSGTAWALSGTMDPPGPYPVAAIVLTDAANQSVSFPIPLTVSPAPVPPVPVAFGFTVEPVMPDGPRSGQRYASYVFEGGTAPYAVALSGSPLPLSMIVRRSDLASLDGQIYAVIDEAGSYDGVRLTVTDGANRQISYALPRFTVTDRAADTTIQVTDIGRFPSVMSVGDTWTSNVFTVSGYRADTGYNVEMVGGPYQISVAPVGDPSANRFQATLTATSDSVGSYAAVGVDIGSKFESSVHKVVTVGDLKVVGTPLQVVSQFPPSTQVATQTDFSVLGRLRGGSGALPVLTLTGVADDANLSLSAETVGDSIEVYLNGALPRDGTYAGIGVSFVDRQTGEKVTFAPFALTAAGTALSDCTSMPAGGDALSARDGEEGTLERAITFRGGAGPYAITPDVAGSVPDALGFSLQVEYAGTGDVRGIAASVAPTGVASMSDVAATLRDAKGHTCPVRLNAYSVAAPDPTQGPMALAEAYTVSDGYNNGSGTAYWQPGASDGGVYFRPAVTVERMRDIALYGDYCTSCMRILIKPPAGKEIALDGPPFDPQFQSPRIKLRSYSSAFADRRTMLTPGMTHRDAADGGGYFPGLVLDFARDMPVAGTWTFVYSVEYTDGTAGLTSPLTVEFHGAGGPMAGN